MPLRFCIWVHFHLEEELALCTVTILEGIPWMFEGTML
jgi:hypothetical protein